MITARKQSLGQGIVFTHVCSQGGLPTRGSAYREGSAYRGVYIQGGREVGQNPPPELEKRAARILLE